MFACSGRLPTPSPQEEKNTASQDQAGQSSTDAGTGDEVSYQTHSVRASVEEHALATWKRRGGQDFRGLYLQRDLGVTASKHSKRHCVPQRVSNVRIVTKL
jgi:hypothetical protein